MACNLVMTLKAMEDRSAWLEARKKGIGGSDAAAIVGLSPFKSAFSLWAEKTGRVEVKEKPLQDENGKIINEFLYWGREQERLIAERFALETGKKVIKRGLLQSVENPFMLASIDRAIIGENAGLECKTTAGWNGEQWQDDEIPAAYIVQCLHYMLVTGFDRFYIACLIGGNKYVCKVLERSELLPELEALEKAEKDFWNNYILTDTAPPLDGNKATCETVKAITAQNTPEGVAELADEYSELCQQIKILDQGIKRMEEKQEALKNKLKLALAEVETATTEGYKISYKERTKTGIDTKKLKEELPEVAEKYATKSSYRQLDIRAVKPKKAKTEE